MKYLEVGESPGINRNCYSQRSQPLRLETVTLISAQVCCNLRCFVVGLAADSDRYGVLKMF